MHASSEIIRLPSNQARSAAAVLARAFHNDPMMQYLMPVEDRRARWLPSLFIIVVRYCLTYGEVHTTPALDGVACWLPPGETNPAFLRLARIGWRNPPIGMRLAGLRRYLRVAHYLEEIHAHAAPQAHWYLWALGVEPAHQGRGYGGLLIQPVLARAKVEGMSCYLETMNSVNVPFYERYGFHVVSDGEAPGSRLRIWAMLRQ
ncbi:MAG TPA: GNAT family N-acetyltransferase [Ktedonobacteraceae bacterium]|nr:GNAT family N-acetyltransferase [Ktedonobacteraceae bacterium]